MVGLVRVISLIEKIKCSTRILIIFLSVIVYEPLKAFAQLCGPSYTPPFPGTPLSLVLLNLSIISSGYFLVAFYISGRKNRALSGSGIFGMGMVLMLLLATPILIHVEKLTDDVNALNIPDSTPEKFHVFCYQNLSCPIIPVVDSDLTYRILSGALKQGQAGHYPYHTMISVFDKWQTETDILSIAGKQVPYTNNPSSAVSQQPIYKVPSYLLYYNQNYYRIFFTYEMPNHYAGIIPLTYHTSEMIFWNFAIAVFFYLLILKLPSSREIISADGAESEKERGRGLSLRFKLALGWVLCDFLENRSLRKTAILAGLFMLPSIYLWQLYNGRPDLAVLFIDAEVIIVAYAISIAVARTLCNKIHRRII